MENLALYTLEQNSKAKRSGLTLIRRVTVLCTILNLLAKLELEFFVISVYLNNRPLK